MLRFRALHPIDFQHRNDSVRRFFVILAAVLPLAVLASACNDATGFGNASITADSSVVLRSASSAIDGPSAVDARGLILVSPERPEAAGQWDFALRQNGNTFSLVSAPAGISSGFARAGLRRSTETFERIEEAPRRRSEYSEEPTVLAEGASYTFRSRQYATQFSTCFNYGKLAVVKLDPAAGTATLAMAVNDNCDDARLTD
ncbi:MAG TPA: hypothetical protein VE913_01200 [Longimicrobium sp.]|nr:hypothetical protein [Longimicrobium sp.]